ncbi:MAG: AAA family ATPase, partial [Ureaplasma sp.]|nr:AAA family ATPase [Ureaplasma sp.]
MEIQIDLQVYFFAGPTGVGKTETCKSLSKFLYNNTNINRFDMSEYKDEFASINKLIGAPNGLVGYEEGGTLINSMKKNPNAIVLFDEIEKADKSIFDLFLQIIDEGYVTSNQGEKISFKNNFIIFTSNLGSSKISPKNTHKENNKIISEHIYHFFNNVINRPEILRRIGKDN